MLNSVRMLLGAASLVCLVILSLCGGGNACSCLPAHPQTHYCNSDFVLLVKVKGKKLVSNDVAYQVKVKKAFKMNNKTSLAIKNGKVWSAKDDGLCGVVFKPHTKYLITGRVDGGKVWISLCNYYEEWAKLTMKQRKGFRLLYKQGCECKIAPRPSRRWSLAYTVNANTCAWETVYESKGGCQGQHSICMRQANGHCHWNKSRSYRDCVKQNEKRKKERRRMEP